MIRTAGLGVLVCAMAAFCAGTAAAQSLSKLNVAVLRYGNQATAYVAKKEGFFKKHGLDVELVEVKSTSQAIIAQRSGRLDIVFVIPGTVFSANERGFDLVALIQNEVARLTPPDGASLQVRSDSPIASLKDLAGKKVGTSGLHSQSQVGIITAMRKAGMDPKRVQFVEMPVESQMAALLSNQLDVANLVDPYTTEAVRSGRTRVISWPNIESVKGQPQGALWARRTWVAKNPELANSFVAAMKEAIDYMNEDADRARKEVSAYTGIDLKLMANMPINNYSYIVSRSVWQQTIDMMRANGEIEKAHTPDEYFSEQMKPYIRP
jgi:NitT/TauT family transport system substrate-binding protein